MLRPDAELAAETVTAHRLRFDAASDELGARDVPIEAPAFEHDDVGYAVMMATLADLEDYAVGFTLTERLATKAEDIADVEVAELPCGWAARITLREDASEAQRECVRRSLTEGSCGLCGLETIEQVLRPLPRLAPGARVTRVAVARAAIGSGSAAPPVPHTPRPSAIRTGRHCWCARMSAGTMRWTS